MRKTIYKSIGEDVLTSLANFGNCNEINIDKLIDYLVKVKKEGANVLCIDPSGEEYSFYGDIDMYAAFKREETDEEFKKRSPKEYQKEMKKELQAKEDRKNLYLKLKQEFEK